MKLASNNLIPLLIGSIALFTFSLSSAQSARLHVTPIAKIKGDFLLMDADIFGKVYAITRSGKFIKFNLQGDSLHSWNDVKRYGVPDAIDVSNPLKPLLLCGGFGQLIVLDKIMIPRNVINLRSKGIMGGYMPAASYDNQIWIFDSLEFKLKKINDNGDVVFESMDLRMSLPKSFQPYGMTDQQNSVFIFSADHEVYGFDYFGYFQYRSSLEKGKIYGMNGSESYQLINNEVVITPLKGPGKTFINLPEEIKAPLHVCIRKQNLFLLDASGIAIFSIEKN
jgi:hypothetical protein